MWVGEEKELRKRKKKSLGNQTHVLGIFLSFKAEF